MVCTLTGQYSGICGGDSFWEEDLTLAEHGKIDVFEINDDDDDDETGRIKIPRDQSSREIAKEDRNVKKVSS